MNKAELKAIIKETIQEIFEEPSFNSNSYKMDLYDKEKQYRNNPEVLKAIANIYEIHAKSLRSIASNL